MRWSVNPFPLVSRSRIRPFLQPIQAIEIAAARLNVFQNPMVVALLIAMEKADLLHWRQDVHLHLFAEKGPHSKGAAALPLAGRAQGDFTIHGSACALLKKTAPRGGRIRFKE